MAKRPSPPAHTTGGTGSVNSTDLKTSAVSGQSVSPDLAAQKSTALEAGNMFNAPYMNEGLTYRNLGTSGLKQYSGWVREEYNPKLMGRDAQRTYREMRDGCAIVAAVIFAIRQVLRKVEWRVEPADLTPQALLEAKFVESLLDDMETPWAEFIAEALTMLEYGFAPHEMVYKKRMGDQPDRTPDNPIAIPSSKYSDGRIGLAGLPIRGQDTVIKWFFDPNGKILGLTQQPYTGGLIDIPMEKLLLFRPLAHKNNPEGYSILRAAVRPWYFLKRLEEGEAIYMWRMSGVPVISIPSDVATTAAGTGPNAASAQVTLQAYKDLVTRTSIDEQMGIVLFSDHFEGQTGPSTAQMYKFELVTPQGGRSGVDFNTPIERYKVDILYTVLCDFIQMGHSSRGTQGLAVSKVDLFFQAVQGWMDSLADVLNRYMIPRIWMLNGLDKRLMPTISPDVAQRLDIDSLGNFILHLSQAGMPLFPDKDLEDYLRDAAGVPPITEDDTEVDPVQQQSEAQLDRTQAEESALGRGQGAADHAAASAVGSGAAPSRSSSGKTQLSALAKILYAALGSSE